MMSSVLSFSKRSPVCTPRKLMDFLPSMYHQSPVSSLTTRGARSANSLSTRSTHRSGGSMMWLSDEIIDSNVMDPTVSLAPFGCLDGVGEALEALDGDVEGLGLGENPRLVVEDGLAHHAAHVFGVDARGDRCVGQGFGRFGAELIGTVALGLEDPRVDRRRAQPGHADARWLQFAAEGLGDRDDGVLGGGVDGHVARAGLEPGGRRRVHDVGLAALLEQAGEE